MSGSSRVTLLSMTILPWTSTLVRFQTLPAGERWGLRYESSVRVKAKIKPVQRLLSACATTLADHP